MARWRQWEPRPASIRFHLRLIVLVAFLPLLVFCFATVVLFAREEQDTFRQGAMERTLALVTGVESELQRSIAALEALATSGHLDSGDLASFHAELATNVSDHARAYWIDRHETER